MATPYDEHERDRFDPNEPLRRARGAYLSLQRLISGARSEPRDAALRDQAEVLAYNFGVLDEWLAQGGELPVSWSR